MKRNKLKRSGSSRSLSSAIVSGIGIALLLSVLLTALLASFILNGRLGENSVSVSIFVVRAISLLAGALIGAKILKHGYLKVVGFVALGYLLALIGTGIIFYDGSFKHFLPGVISVLTGGLIALVVLLKPTGSKIKIKKYSV